MRSLVVGLLLVAASCGKDNANATNDPPPTAPEPPPKKKIVVPGVDLVVNGATITHVTPEQAQPWIRLDTLLPENARKLGKWASLTLTVGDKPQEITKPTERYPDKIPALYPGSDGAVAFGMFDAVEFSKHGKPAFEQLGLSQLDVKLAPDNGHGGNDEGSAPPGDPTKTSLTIKSATGEVTLVGDKLLGIPRESPPDGGDGQGWSLATLLKAGGVKKFDKLTLTGAGGTNLMLDKTDVTDSSIVFLKLNRQAKLRLKVFKKKGDGWNTTGDLKDVQRVDVK